MTLLAFSLRHVTEFRFHRHTTGVGHLHHLAGELEILLQRTVGGIDHHAVKAQTDRFLHFVDAAAVIEVERHRYLGLFSCSLQCRHQQTDIVTGEVRF